MRSGSVGQIKVVADSNTSDLPSKITPLDTRSNNDDTELIIQSNRNSSRIITDSMRLKMSKENAENDDNEPNFQIIEEMKRTDDMDEEDKIEKQMIVNLLSRNYEREISESGGQSNDGGGSRRGGRSASYFGRSRKNR